MEDTAGTAHGGADMKATTGRLTPENRPLLPSTSTVMGSAEGGGAKTSDVGLCNVWALWYLALSARSLRVLRALSARLLRALRARVWRQC